MRLHIYNIFHPNSLKREEEFAKSSVQIANNRELLVTKNF